MAAVGDDATGLTQRELLMEMREDIRGLRASVDAIARDQALGVERRAAMRRSADSITPASTGTTGTSTGCRLREPRRRSARLAR